MPQIGLKEVGEHECDNLLVNGAGERIKLFRSTVSVDVAVSRIPAIILLPEQSKRLIEEGRQYYKEHSGGKNWWPQEVGISAEKAAQVYAQTRHLETAVAFVLSELFS